jgi:hypothetical protein
MAAAVSALDTWEFQRRAGPGRIIVASRRRCVGDFSVRGGFDTFRIPTDASVDVSVVDACCGYYNQDFIGSWGGVIAILELVEATVVGQDYSDHFAGNWNRWQDCEFRNILRVLLVLTFFSIILHILTLGRFVRAAYNCLSQHTCGKLLYFL